MTTRQRQIPCGGKPPIMPKGLKTGGGGAAEVEFEPAVVEEEPFDITE